MPGSRGGRIALITAAIGFVLAKLRVKVLLSKPCFSCISSMKACTSGFSAKLARCFAAIAGAAAMQRISAQMRIKVMA